MQTTPITSVLRLHGLKGTLRCFSQGVECIIREIITKSTYTPNLGFKTTLNNTSGWMLGNFYIKFRCSQFLNNSAIWWICWNTIFVVMDLLEFAQPSQKVEAPPILRVHNFIVLLETSSISYILMMWGFLHSPSWTWNLNLTVSKWKSPIPLCYFQVPS